MYKYFDWADKNYIYRNLSDSFLEYHLFTFSTVSVSDNITN